MDASAGAPPLSVAQEALWYLTLLAPGQISYNEMITIRKDGAFDAAIFRRSFNEVVRRHETWHTTFDNVGGAAVQVLRHPPNFDLPILDLGDLSFAEAEDRAVALAAQVSSVPYELRRGPLLRPRLVKFPCDHHRLYLGMHHIVFDGVSVYRVVLPELVALYNAFSAGEPSPLPEPTVQYSDYALWEQNWMSEPRTLRRLEHWRQHLSSLPALLLPLDRRRPATQRFVGGVVPLSVPKETVGQLREAGQRVGATLFQVLATTWSLLLGRYAGQEDVVFATAADLRQRPEFESVVGYSLTPLVLRVDLSGDPTFSDLVVRVRNELLDGLDNLVPFERLVRGLKPTGVSNANPVYQSMIILEPPTVAPDPSWSIHQMESAIGDAVGTAKLDLDLELDERPEGHISGRVIYDRDLFDEKSAERIAAHWLGLLDAVAKDPTIATSSLPTLSVGERGDLTHWNATTTLRPPGAVHDLVRAQSVRQPFAPAVSADGQVMAYAELDRRSGKVAEHLRSVGVGAGDVVALYSELSADLVVGILGVLKAQAAYLLLDPALPAEQLAFMVADSGAVAVLADPELARAMNAQRILVFDLGHLDDGQALAPAPPADADPGALCCLEYVIDASGTPIGVPVRHSSVVNLCGAMADGLGIGPADTILVLPSTFFGFSILELWMALSLGAKIVLAEGDGVTDGLGLSRLIATERVSFLHASPTDWQALIDSGLRASRGLSALSGGEELTEELADRILDRARVLWNAYGTPQTTGYSTLARVERAKPVTIGRPIANARVHVLDRDGQPVPIGLTGELFVAGEGVVSGYLNRAELTAHAFIDDPIGSGRAFRTGDIGRWRTDGELELTAHASPDTEPEVSRRAADDEIVTGVNSLAE
jgi:amino acid adenylation domain-containing protein